ncbi:MAG: hypothetical protein HC912_00210 [Saprospiraceae bacterium]|nr:hypothetical protein [Saprospiraceae bacterium]
MVITTVGNKMVIELPKDLIDVTVVQAFLDYLRYKSLVSKSQATEEDVQRLTEEKSMKAWQNATKGFNFLSY